MTAHKNKRHSLVSELGLLLRKDEVGTATESMLRELKTQLNINIDVPDITVRIDGAPEMEKCFKDWQINTEWDLIVSRARHCFVTNVRRRAQWAVDRTVPQ